MFNNPFYFSIIRKYITLFGSLFSEIQITRTDSGGVLQDLMIVPITYGPKDKMLTRINQDPNIDRPSALTLPIMSFEINGIQYDSSRKLNTVNRISLTNPENTAQKNYTYSPVPYNIDFILSIYVKNSEDGTKIIEQILPYFTPDWTSTVHLIPELNLVLDVPVILNTVELSDLYEGQFEARRVLIWTLNFTLKGQIYGPVQTANIIKFSNTNIFVPLETPDGQLQTAVGLTNSTVKINIQPGLTPNNQPTSNSSLSIPVANITGNTNYGYVETIVENNG